MLTILAQTSGGGSYLGFDQGSTLPTGALTFLGVVEDEVEEEELPTFEEAEEDLEDLPFDTGAVR
ncbi:MAG: hypothetical protein CME24_00925 [Gemmatimonadetes bacterium]|nr:hypothetical protein [Gemmatimonadota bacterium]